MTFSKEGINVKKAKSVDTENEDAIRAMPKCSKESARDFLMRRIPEPMLFEMAVCKGWIEYRGCGIWQGVSIDHLDAFEPAAVVEVPDQRLHPPRRAKLDPKSAVKPTSTKHVPTKGQLELF